MPYIPPELRQDETSVAAVKDRSLPKLVEFTDLRGDLHRAHRLERRATYTSGDGRSSEGRRAGILRYHGSLCLVYRGERIRPEATSRTVAQVRELAAKVEGITVLAGSEVDIPATR